MSGAPVKAAAGFMFFIGIVVLLMWSALIIPPLMRGERPAALETYTTLVIQALDMGVMAPHGAHHGHAAARNEMHGATRWRRLC